MAIIYNIYTLAVRITNWTSESFWSQASLLQTSCIKTTTMTWPAPAPFMIRMVWHKRSRPDLLTTCAYPGTALLPWEVNNRVLCIWIGKYSRGGQRDSTHRESDTSLSSPNGSYLHLKVQISWCIKTWISDWLFCFFYTTPSETKVLLKKSYSCLIY